MFFKKKKRPIQRDNNQAEALATVSLAIRAWSSLDEEIEIKVILRGLLLYFEEVEG